LRWNELAIPEDTRRFSNWSLLFVIATIFFLSCGGLGTDFIEKEVEEI